ncbi:MAG TPA: peptidylprolyl isomerase, partial [Pirellulaceae bacterium]|nr:peptidylprolyl isomerase [Pirellulaceae bacterium]
AMVRAKVNSPAELDQLLRKYGTSLEKQRRVYMEQKLGRAMMGRDITYRPEITHDEILAYYSEHAKDFDVQARAKWEQMTVRFANHQTAEDPTGKVGAWAKIASMGNEVLRNAKFDAVAKRHSEAPNADQGGLADWITKGSLASLPLENAIFTLPPNQLSAIIEDDRSFHIVRVLEREEATRVDFVAAQEKIKEKIKEQKVEKQVNEYVAKLKAKTSVWTIYDGEPTDTKTATKPAKSDAFVPRLQ